MDELQVEILESIGGWGFNFQTLYSKCKDFKGSKIRVPINSWGGDAFQGLLIHNYLKGHKASVEVHIPAYAASAGTMIAAAADHVTMADNGYYMIHNPASYQYGEAADMERSADLLKKLRSDMIDMYHAKTGLPKEEIGEMMDAETWMTAKEALKKGFVDALTKGAKIHASADIAIFQNAPEELRKSTALPDEPAVAQNQIAKMDQLKIIAGFLGLNTEASLVDIQSSINSLRTQNAALAEQNKTLTAEVKQYKNAEKGIQAKEAETLIAAALTEKRITNEQVPQMRKVFEADHENGKLLLASMTPVVKLSDYPNTGAAGGDGGVMKYNGKTFSEWSKEKPQVLADLKQKDLSTFKALFKSEYGKEYEG